jgi:hypothetical protein
MPADFAALQAEIDALSQQVAATEGTEASAKALIEGFATQIQTAVTEALTADNSADAASIAAASAAIAGVKERFAASAASLGAAIPSTPGPGPGPGETQPEA